MIQSTACVPTANAGKYIMGLCRNWDDQIDVDFRARQGVIHFESAVATLTPRTDQLVVTIVANDLGTIERFQNVVAQRIDRLARREALPKFSWHRFSDLEFHAL